MIRAGVSIFVLLAWLSPVASPAWADVVIEIGSTTITPSGKASVDVLARSNGAPIDIAGFDLFFEISLNALSPSPSGALDFRPSFNSSSPTDPNLQNNNEQQEPNYIFFNLTTSANFAAFRPGNPTLLAVGDSTLSAGNLTNVALDGNWLLIARLELQQIQPGSETASGIYDIRLSTSDPSTYYAADDEFNRFTINLAQSSSGTATVTAVPEASAVAFMAVAVVMPASYYICRRRKFGRAVKP